MTIWLNCADNAITFNKKNYLLRAAGRCQMEHIFQDIKNKGDSILNFVLNIVPYNNTFITGKQWTGVWELDQICNRQQAGMDWYAADTVFLTALGLPDHLKNAYKEKHRLLFQACDPHLHDRMGPPSYDFVQCGSGGDGIYSERTRLFNLLKTKFTFWDFGKDYDPVSYVRNISKARVQFIRSSMNSFATGEIAQRFFECLAIGPVLTNWVEDLNHTGLIEDVDYMAYRTDDEMMEKMDRLIKDEELRNTIAKSGRTKALMYHSYEQRLGSIFNIAQFERK